LASPNEFRIASILRLNSNDCRDSSGIASALRTLRGQWMYFYTSLGRGNGLAGVNLNTGQTDREVRLSELDERFVTDELLGGLFTASGNKLLSHGLH
jgi:hypothetical protein